MPDNQTLTPAARRMLTALGGATFANDLAKTYDDTLKNHPNNKWAPSEIARYNAAAEAAQDPPAWVPVADVPEEWKDGRELVARFHGDNPGPCVIVEYAQSSGTWCGDNGDVLVSHLCDCIPRSGP